MNMWRKGKICDFQKGKKSRKDNDPVGLSKKQAQMAIQQ